jgi:hypothetical protein
MISRRSGRFERQARRLAAGIAFGCSEEGPDLGWALMVARCVTKEASSLHYS